MESNIIGKLELPPFLQGGKESSCLGKPQGRSQQLLI